MKLYKYLDSKYVDSFWEKGEMRIGSLSSFRETEKLGDEIGHVSEGTSSASDVPLSIKADYGQRLEIGVGNEGPVRVSFVAISYDAFVYCLTEESRSDCRQRLGYTSGFVVNDVSKFAYEVEKCLRNKHSFLPNFALGKCVYLDHDKDEDAIRNAEPSLVKASRFGYQKEHRILWFAPDFNTRLDPIVLEVPKARSFCSVLPDH